MLIFSLLSYEKVVHDVHYIQLLYEWFGCILFNILPENIPSYGDVTITSEGFCKI